MLAELADLRARGLATEANPRELEDTAPDPNHPPIDPQAMEAERKKHEAAEKLRREAEREYFLKHGRHPPGSALDPVVARRIYGRR